MRYLTLTILIAGIALAGCGVDSEVTQSDVEKNRKEFSQENYEAAMIKAGKGKELEEEKKRNAAHMAAGGQGQEEGQH
jgi:hypothetical protein